MDLSQFTIGQDYTINLDDGNILQGTLLNKNCFTPGERAIPKEECSTAPAYFMSFKHKVYPDVRFLYKNFDWYYSRNPNNHDQLLQYVSELLPSAVVEYAGVKHNASMPRLIDPNHEFALADAAAAAGGGRSRKKRRTTFSKFRRAKRRSFRRKRRV